MARSSEDVVIVGGGIAGMAAAYYLAKSGVPSIVVERDAIGSHASGFAYGGLSPMTGFGIPGPLAEIAHDGMRLHRELAPVLAEETGIDVDFRLRASLALAFTEADGRRLRAPLPPPRAAVAAGAAGLCGVLARPRGGAQRGAADLGRDARGRADRGRRRRRALSSGPSPHPGGPAPRRGAS